MIVMLTALAPQRQCAICKHASDEYQLVASSFRYSSAFSNKVFFAMVDFDEGADVFQSLKLNSAPVFMHFPAKMKQVKADSLDISRRGFDAEQLARWVRERTNVEIRVQRPPNYSGILLSASACVTLAGFLYVMRKRLTFLYSYVVWGLSVITLICFFISGQTWNMINGPPFMSNRKNDMGIIADDSNMQYVAETYIVFLLYFGVSAGIILLNEAPKIRSKNGKRKGILAVTGILVVVFLFSFLLSIFRSKYHGYPYSFLIK